MANKLEYFARVYSPEFNRWFDVDQKPVDNHVDGWQMVFDLRAQNPDKKFDLKVRVIKDNTDAGN